MADSYMLAISELSPECLLTVMRYLDSLSSFMSASLCTPESQSLQKHPVLTLARILIAISRGTAFCHPGTAALQLACAASGVVW